MLTNKIEKTDKGIFIPEESKLFNALQMFNEDANELIHSFTLSAFAEMSKEFPESSPETKQSIITLYFILNNLKFNFKKNYN